MRNAGEGTPGGPTGRRQRTAPPPAARPASNGGASLFTPAYRVRHAAVPSQANVATSRPGSPDYGVAVDDQATSGYSWSGVDQSGLDYQQADYADHGRSNWDSDEPASGYSWLTSDESGSGWPGASFASPSAARNAIRGFAPAPDEPLPVYPPGPFAAWNRSATERGGRPDRPKERDASGRVLAAAAKITPDEFDTDYSMPAIKDPIPGAAATRSRTDRPATGQTRSPATAVSDQRSAAPSRGGSRRSGGSRGGPAQPGRGKPAAADRPVESKHHSVKLAIGVATVVVVAVIAVLVIPSLGGTSTTPPVTSPSQPAKGAHPTPKPPAGKWEYIGTRATDAIPLTLQELFPSSFVTSGGSFHVAARKGSANCHGALIGSTLQAAMHKAHCTQALRATYVSHDLKAMATIGVFNLTSASAAGTAAKHTGPSQFVAALTTKKGATAKIGQGTGVEEAVDKGHYLVLIWAENTDLAEPKTSWQRNHLTDFMDVVIQQTVNGGLSYRMVEGKPQSKK